MLPEVETGIDIRERSILSLAFVGDGVLELLVRAKLVAQSHGSPGALHRTAVKLVSARAQARLLESLLPMLSEEEAGVVRRGRNASKATVSKNASVQEYRASTGLEALFGWLYLQNRQQRIHELFQFLWQDYTQNAENTLDV